MATGVVTDRSTGVGVGDVTSHLGVPHLKSGSDVPERADRRRVRPVAPQGSLLSSVLETAGLAPHRPAVNEAGAVLTYVDLMLQSQRVAEALDARGVRHGDRIGVLLAPGADAVTTMIAAMRLGAAYIPLDPAQPWRRTETMLNACQARVCVSSAAVPPGDCPTVTVAELVTASSACSAGPVHVPTAEDIAYVVHTSGSTGVPKGVEVERRSVVNLLVELDRLAPVRDGFRGSWWTLPSFDVAVWESWAPLYRGGTVVVVPPEYRLEGPRLAEYLAAADIQSAYVPVAFLPDLLTHFERNPGSCRQLVRLLVGVEPVPRGLLQDLMRLRPKLAIVNGYGPAETTICCTLHVVPRAGGSRAERTPIGQAVSGNRLYVVDVAGRPAASGAGELVVAGIGVARGYVGAEAAEAGRFIADPAGGEGRAYRTGDLVRTLSDGNLVFEGRVDRQLKVRGYRVEPGEVETALRRVAALRDAAVSSRYEPVRGAYLVAFVVPEAGTGVDHRVIMARLHEILPAYAVPSSIISLERLPLTPNGKIDHQCLADMPLPPAADTAAVGLRAGTGTGMSATVVQVWREVLGTADIRPTDSFARIGGTSLAAVRVAARLRAVTGKDVSVAEVLRARSADELAMILDVAKSPPALRQGHSRGLGTVGRNSGPLSPGQLGLWVHDQMETVPGTYTETVCFHLQGEIDVKALRSAVSRAAAAHPAFGAVVGFECGRPLLELRGREPEFTVSHVRPGPDEPGGDADHVLAAQARRPFDLTAGPLLRCLLLRRSKHDSVVLFSWHHLVVDGWSVRLFLNDLADCYRDSTFKPIRGPRTICDLNACQAEEAASVAGQARVDAAVGRLRGLPAAITWPSRVDIDARLCSVVPVTVPNDLAGRIAAAAAHGGLTVAAVVCAAYQRAMSRILGVDRFLMGCAASARTDPDAEQIAGYGVNTILVRGVSPRDVGAGEHARAVAVELALALEYQEAPFPHVARRLFRGAVHRPVRYPQLYLSIDTEPMLELRGIMSSIRSLYPVRAKFDVTLSLQQSPGRLTGVLEHRTAAIGERAAVDLVQVFQDDLSDIASALSGEAGVVPESDGTGRSGS